ncbi:MAG: DNA polymerase/3'-5' exonuclease PolX [Desulfobacterales bacterium]|nr:DNA polymerase/3'-5' exonuclease PolX [Desulfobacterales bacterium]
MTVQNKEISDIFSQVADLMEIKGENPFRVRAYREAARLVEGMSEQMHKRVQEEQDLTQFRGIGKDLAKKIKEIIDNGNLQYLEELKAELPASLLDLLAIPALGPKKVSAIYHKLGIATIDGLKNAAEAGKIASLEGFGAKTEKNILDSLGRLKKAAAKRILLGDAKPVAASLEAHIKSQKGVKRVTVAGSFRRGKETVGDLDILVTCRRGYEKGLMKAFVEFEDVARIDAHGQTKSSVHLRSGLQVDLRIVPEVSYGAALHYFTGSKAHNVAVRKLAVERGLKINEYGVYRNDDRIAGETETAVYKEAGLAYIEPELRENMGEIEAARNGALPRLIKASDIRGDLHLHTTRSDGKNSLEEMAEAAKNLGYEYIAITEHSKQVAMAGGLNEKQVREHMAQIDRINEKTDGITLLKGMEVDILTDGTLDLSNSVLKELDLTVCSVHYQQRLTGDKQTERIIRAMDNPYCNILGHPMARLLNKRDPMDIDLDAIIGAARARGVIIELNGQPERLDLPHSYCKTAAEHGVKLAISTDAHSADNLSYMQNGVTEARRGWLTKKDVVNTLPLKELLAALKRR